MSFKESSSRGTCISRTPPSSSRAPPYMDAKFVKLDSSLHQHHHHHAAAAAAAAATAAATQRYTEPGRHNAFMPAWPASLPPANYMQAAYPSPPALQSSRCSVSSLSPDSPTASSVAAAAAAAAAYHRSSDPLRGYPPYAPTAPIPMTAASHRYSLGSTRFSRGDSTSSVGASTPVSPHFSGAHPDSLLYGNFQGNFPLKLPLMSPHKSLLVDRSCWGE